MWTFLTEDSENFKKINHFAYESIAQIISNDEDAKNIQIYSSDSKNKQFQNYIQNFEYIGKQMDWDFSQSNIKDEIKQMQFDNVKTSGKLRSIIDNLEFNIEDFKFEPLNYIEFSNNGWLNRWNEKICLLVCKHEVMKKDHMIKNFENQYGLDENGTLTTGWDGGMINSGFVKKVKEDSNNNVIDYSKYYGLGEFEDLYSDFLVGYGTTTIEKSYYADIPMAKITLTTALTVPYGAKGIVDIEI